MLLGCRSTTVTDSWHFLWVRKYILHSCSDSFAIHFGTSDLEKYIWNLVLFLSVWVSTVSTCSRRHAHAHAWPVVKATQFGIYIQQVILEQFSSKRSPYKYCSAFLSHSLLFIPMLSLSSFLILRWTSESYFSSTGTFKGMWAVKLKVDCFTGCEESPIKIWSYLNCFSWPPVEAYFIAACHTVLKSHLSDGSLASAV